jgi:hypothetical protein
MNLILIGLFIFVVFWLLGALGQSAKKEGKGVHVPYWLAKASGSSTSWIDPGILAIQVFALLLFLWIIFLALAVAPGNYRVVLLKQGIIVSLLLSGLLRILLRYIPNG